MMFGNFGILAKGEGYMVRIVPSVFLLVVLIILIKGRGEAQLAKSPSHISLGPFLRRSAK